MVIGHFLAVTCYFNWKIICDFVFFFFFPHKFYYCDLRLEQGNCLLSFCSGNIRDDGKERMDERYFVVFSMALKTLPDLVPADSSPM